MVEMLQRWPQSPGQYDLLFHKHEDYDRKKRSFSESCTNHGLYGQMYSATSPRHAYNVAHSIHHHA